MQDSFTPSNSSSHNTFLLIKKVEYDNSLISVSSVNIFYSIYLSIYIYIYIYICVWLIVKKMRIKYEQIAFFVFFFYMIYCCFRYLIMLHVQQTTLTNMANDKIPKALRWFWYFSILMDSTFTYIKSLKARSRRAYGIYDVWYMHPHQSMAPHIYIHDHMVGDHVGDINPLMCLNKLPSEKTAYKLYIVELIHAYILTQCSFYNIIRVPRLVDWSATCYVSPIAFVSFVTRTIEIPRKVGALCINIAGINWIALINIWNIYSN